MFVVCNLRTVNKWKEEKTLCSISDRESEREAPGLWRSGGGEIS